MTAAKTPEDPLTTLAVAIGRLEEGQKHLMEGFKDVSESVRDVPVIRRDVNDLLEWRNEWRKASEARKPPWTAIAAVVIAGFTLVKQYLGF